MPRALPLASLLALPWLLAGCASAALSPLEHPELQSAQREAIREIARDYSLPLRIEVRAAGDPGPEGLALARAQIEAFEEAYRRSPFDAFALEVRLDPARTRPRAPAGAPSRGPPRRCASSTRSGRGGWRDRALRGGSRTPAAISPRRTRTTSPGSSSCARRAYRK